MDKMKLPTKSALLAPMLLDALLTLSQQVQQHQHNRAVAAQQLQDPQTAPPREDCKEEVTAACSPTPTPTDSKDASAILPFTVAHVLTSPIGAIEEAAKAPPPSTLDPHNNSLLSDVPEASFRLTSPLASVTTHGAAGNSSERDRDQRSTSCDNGSAANVTFTPSLGHMMANASSSTAAASQPRALFDPTSTTSAPPTPSPSSVSTATSLFGAAPSPVPSSNAPQSFTAQRAAQLGVNESNLLHAYRLFRHLIDSIATMKESAEFCYSETLRKLLPPIRLLSWCDHTMALYACAFIANVVGFAECRLPVCDVAGDLFDITLQIASRYVLERRALHLALMTLSNIVLCDVMPDAVREGDCRQLMALIMPQYSESPVFDAWCCAMCNLVAAQPEAGPIFIKLGAVETVQRILMFFGDDSRVVSRGFQLLSNLCTSAANMGCSRGASQNADTDDA